MERPENGMEDSKKREGDKGKQTHAKPPPTAPADLGSGDRGPPPEDKGRAPDSSRGQMGSGAGASSKFS